MFLFSQARKKSIDLFPQVTKLSVFAFQSKEICVFVFQAK